MHTKISSSEELPSYLSLLAMKAAIALLMRLKSFCGIWMSTYKKELKNSETQLRASVWETWCETFHGIENFNKQKPNAMLEISRNRLGAQTFLTAWRGWVRNGRATTDSVGQKMIVRKSSQKTVPQSQKSMPNILAKTS